MKRVVVSIVLLAFVLLLPDRMLAQWVSADGPYVDAGGVFAQVGSNLFIATENYVFRSTNNGDSWTPVNNGLPEDGIYSLLGVGTKLYAGADASSGSLHVSSDSGASWKKLDVMYFKNGIKQPIGDVMSLASMGENLFVGTSYGLVLRSDNEGDSWTLVKGNMSNSVTLMAHEYTLYAGTHRICSSTNQGNDWTDCRGLLSGTRVVSFAKIATHLFAATNGVGVIHSPDEGITWDTVDNGLPDTTVNTLLASGNALFAGTRSRGVFVSSNYGASWSPSNNGLTDTTVTSLIEHGKYLFASTPNQGILRSSDQGTSWTEANIGFSGTSLVSSILSSGDYLFAGTYKGGAYRHNGVNWRSSKVGLQTMNAGSFAVQDSVLFVGLYSVPAADQRRGVFRSSDDGDSWSPYNTGPRSDVYSLAVNDVNVFAGTQIGVYRSTDYGENWNDANGPLTGGMGRKMSYQNILSLASLGTTIFAGGYESVFVSTNYGSTWSFVKFNVPTNNINSLAAVGTNMFAATFDRGVFRISGGGDTFTAVSAGLSGNSVNSLAVSGTNLFAGTVGGGVFLTTDMGKTWTSINDGLPYSSVTALAVHKGNLYAGAASIVEFRHGAGVFVRPLSEIVTTVNETSTNELTPSLLSQNFPNPFTNVTDIEFTLRESAHVSISIYNTLGALVQTIASREFQAGLNTARWDASSHEVGLYFYRIDVGSRSETKSLLIMR